MRTVVNGLSRIWDSDSDVDVNDNVGLTAIVMTLLTSYSNNVDADSNSDSTDSDTDCDALTLTIIMQWWLWEWGCDGRRNLALFLNADILAGSVTSLYDNVFSAVFIVVNVVVIVCHLAAYASRLPTMPVGVGRGIFTHPSLTSIISRFTPAVCRSHCFYLWFPAICKGFSGMIDKKTWHFCNSVIFTSTDVGLSSHKFQTLQKYCIECVLGCGFLAVGIFVRVRKLWMKTGYLYQFMLLRCYRN